VARDPETQADFKKKSLYAAEQDRPDVAQARRHWFEQFAGIRLNQLVFIDEFGAATNMCRSRARGLRGKRIVCKTPHGHWKILSTIAAMHSGGILTACSFNGATDTAMFVAFVEQFLVPKLKPGQIVVLDNLAPHKSPRVAQLIASAGARLLRLPPYSPDYNPIEMAISKMKAILRREARRDFESLFDVTGLAIKSITARDAINFIRHCGYAMIA